MKIIQLFIHLVALKIQLNDAASSSYHVHDDDVHADDVHVATALSYEVEEHWFHSRIDHFNYQPTPTPTFPLRYCINQDYWNPNHPNNATVLFYAGNEADIYQFINNTGSMFEIAHKLNNTLIVFAEHRYYGSSKPFGNHSLQKGYNISFLTVEQAMEDFNTLNLHIRQKWNLSMSTPFIVFGGSYGANLAMWLRLKQPNLWAGAIASSVTPLKHVLRETNDFARIETEAYANVSKICPHLVRQGWKDLYEYSTTIPGRRRIANELSLCQHPLLLGEDGHDGRADGEVSAELLHGWISSALETMVQYGYPYPTSFYNPVPAYPFKVTCEKMQQSKSGLGALKAAASVYYNYTGQAGICFDLDSMIIPNAMQYLVRRKNRLANARSNLSNIMNHAKNFKTNNVILNSNINTKTEESRIRMMRRRRILTQQGENVQSETDLAWDYQTCTEVYQPMPTNGITDFEIPYKPNKTEYFAYCRERWDTTPRPDWEEM